MTTVQRSTEVPVSADRAWALIGRPESISDWHPAITESPLEGTSRSCLLADGARITEEIRHHDDASRTYTYVITGGPLPVKDYASTLRVEALDDERCRIEWGCTFEALAPEAEVSAMIEGVYDAGLTAAAERLS